MLNVVVARYGASFGTGSSEKTHEVSSMEGLCHEETWLILPVVICLSQRLSHACLSISSQMVKLRMAH